MLSNYFKNIKLLIVIGYLGIYVTLWNSVEGAIDCDPSCQDGQCFGNGTDQCIACAPHYVQQPLADISEPEFSDNAINEDEINFSNSSNTTTTSTTSSSSSTSTSTTTTATVVTTQQFSDFLCLLQCHPGWYPYSGICYPCEVSDCSICTDNGTICQVCSDGWNLDGNECKEFSTAEVVLLSLTCIFGAIVLVAVILAIVMAVRMQLCVCSCNCECPSIENCCGPCNRLKKPKQPASRPPGKEDINIQQAVIHEPELPVPYTSDILKAQPIYDEVPKDETVQGHIVQDDYYEDVGGGSNELPVAPPQTKVNKTKNKPKKISQAPKPAVFPKLPVKQRQSRHSEIASEEHEDDVYGDTSPEAFYENLPNTSSGITGSDPIYNNDPAGYVNTGNAGIKGHKRSHLY